MTDSVCIAYLHQQDVSHSWHVSYTASLLYDMRPGGPHYLKGEFLAQYGNEAGYDHARNKVAKAFLDEYESDWLWWVDSDMGWSFEALEQLMSVADAKERPVVGGLCFGCSPSGDDGGNGHVFRTFPTVYALGSEGFHPVFGYPVNEAVPVAGTGSAFILIHRTVLEKVRERWGDVWYDRLPHPTGDTPFGEDLSFCLRLIQLEIPVYVHTGARTNHHKFHYLSEDYWLSTLHAPPASEQVAVIVPVMQRPQNAEPFMQSLRASTGLATVYAVADQDDTATWLAWQKAGAQLLFSDHGTSFAAKVNCGYGRTTEPWLFLCGDDVRFRPGWLDHALHVANIQDAAVVGTNDKANPRVMRGEHATHMLIHRAYIDEHGASWDGPGVVCHEGYGHWFVDDEIVTAAKQRGQFAAALGSVVEHHHPITGRVEMDAVYEKGQATAEKDRHLFKRRYAKQKVAA